ncbi:hypothetical protein JTB14_031645 [Gonioctena quinquepunctata]|nr:hypothetical protein JTB14_031645 [Gonioctena quinquepunctata]
MDRSLLRKWNNKKKRKFEESDEESDADSLFSLHSESSIGANSTVELTDDQTLQIENYVLVQFPPKTSVIYQVGRIEEIPEIDEFKIYFLRKKFETNKFVYPDIPDISDVNRMDIIAIFTDTKLVNKY